MTKGQPWPSSSGAKYENMKFCEGKWREDPLPYTYVNKLASSHAAFFTAAENFSYGCEKKLCGKAWS